MQTNVVDTDACARILGMIPQAPPFRFVDSIDLLSDTSVAGSYRFRVDDWFYAGHFPGNPVTPGVILIECMAQIGVVALGLYLQEKSGRPNNRIITLFTEAEAAFYTPVMPGAKVRVIGNLVYFRHAKIKVKTAATLEDGSLAAEAVLAGQGVPAKEGK